MAGKEPNPQGYLDFWGNTPTDPTTAQGKTFAPVSSGSSNANPLPPQLKGGQSRVINQIEQAADYYGPAIYQLLGFHSSLELSSDLNEDFIPIAQTKANPKLFVVGLIPPTANITGRTLDRSASIGATEGYPYQDLDFSGPASQSLGALGPTGNAPGGIVTANGYKLDQGSGTATNLPGTPNTTVGQDQGPAKYQSYTVPQLWSTLAQAYRDYYNREPTNTEMQLYTAQALNETANRNGTGASVPNNNFGGIGSSKTPHTNGQSFEANTYAGTRYFTTYPDASTGARAFIARVTGGNPNVMAAAQDGDVLGYTTSLAQTSYYEESASQYYQGVRNRVGQVARGMSGSGLDLDNGSDLPKNAPNCCAFKETGSEYLRRAGYQKSRRNRFIAGSPYDANCPLNADVVQPQDGSNGDWGKDGSPNASASRKNDDKTADRVDLNKTDLGMQYQNAQRAESAMTAKALDIMRTTPPLRLLVNPASMKISSERVVSDGNFTREGPIIEHWGEQQDKLSLSGKIAAFFAIDSQPSTDQNNLGGGPGLTRVARQYSASYQNFLSLYLLYRNNGGLFVNTFNDTTIKNNLLARLSLIGSIYIYYDNTLYIGSFDSFNVTEADTTPYSLEYNIEFTVRATFLLDGPTETDYNVLKAAQQPQTLPTTSNQSLVSNTGGGQVPLPPGLDPSVYAALNETEAASYDFRNQSTGGT